MRDQDFEMFSVATGTNGYRMTCDDLSKFNRSMKQIFKVQGILLKEYKKKSSKMSKETILLYRGQMKKLLERVNIYKCRETSMEEKLEFDRELRMIARVVYSTCGNK
jgi:hypothetical protein